MAIKRFFLQRDEDVSGVSGTGVVAEGVEWFDGTVTLRWLTCGGSTAVYNSLAQLAAIHGHNGATRIIAIDGLPEIKPEPQYRSRP